MRNKNNIAITVGIAIFGVLAILIAWTSMVANNPEIAVDTVYGSVRLPEAISRFEAEGANGLVTIESGEQAERLPIGQYRNRFWKIKRKDDSGNTWALTGHYFGQDNKFVITDGNETKLDVGEPIIASVNARNVGSSYSFNQVIKGRHQEIIELTRNGSRPQPPKLHIKNKDGSYDRTFSFEYG